MQVLVYNGSGVSAASRDHTLSTLRSFLSSRYDVQLVTPKSLRTDPWPASTALLVFPGGRDLPYQYDLAGPANARIRDWVRSGGRYLGFCAGAYYASARVEFMEGTELEVMGDRELGFFPGVCRGTVWPEFEYETEAGAREAKMELNRTAFRDHWSQSPEEVAVWYNGGGAFILPDNVDPNIVQPLAAYSELPNKPLAGVCCTVGAGKAVLWATHPEHPSFSTSDPLFSVQEQKRQALIRATLSILGLDVPDSETPPPPPQLKPLFLTSPDLSLVNSIAQSIIAKSTSQSPDSYELKDRHDHFIIHPHSSASQLLADAVATPGTSNVDELHSAVKHICVCSEPVDLRERAPLFDLAGYYETLAKETGKSSPQFGKVILYGESVTSSQTLLDKNDKFLSCLPSGLALLASHQIAGRGRGSNTWVSPAGCLQFSIILRLPQAQAPKIVFVQYLFGLAVVEAVRRTRGYEEVGIVLKWPNDVYGEVGEKEYKKIGGILVNSSYFANEFSLVVGCGVNTSNPKPTTSLNELIDHYNARTGSSLAPFTPEALLAKILAQLERMWDSFTQEGFEPFLDDYLSRWIHSNQRVTIQATGQVVKIVGITPEHGLLRTLPIDVDRNGREVYGGGSSRNYIDLQPDGNGFDMIQGLLVSRAT